MRLVDFSQRVLTWIGRDRIRPQSRMFFPKKISRLALIACALVSSLAVWAQPGTEAFHWVNFHQGQPPLDAKDADTVTWVMNALKAEHWTAVREIGVQWDSALVITSERKNPQSTPATDVYTIWTVSLAKREVQPLLKGVNLRIVNWTNFGGPYQKTPELAIVWDDCTGCDAASTSFTTLYYNLTDHEWRGRWMRGDQGAALSSTGAVEGVTRTQIYGLLRELPGRDVLATWSHFDYGNQKPAEDFVFEYSVDPSSTLEQTQGLSGDHAQQMMQRLCKADPGQADSSLAELAHGQDSQACAELSGSPKASRAKAKLSRHVTTTPPANNHGQSSPPGGHAKTAAKPTAVPATAGGPPAKP